jgi:hypothetical protein
MRAADVAFPTSFAVAAAAVLTPARALAAESRGDRPRPLAGLA